MLHDDILGTVGNTPIVRINKLAPKGVTMYAKLEAFNPMSSVKDRLALGIILDAEQRGALRPGSGSPWRPARASACAARSRTSRP
jgi:cysteine synthase